MTKINFQRTGGILGRRIETTIDLNELPAAESQEIMELIAETNFFKIPQNLIPGSRPDEFEYTVTVQTGNTRHTVHASDGSAPLSLRPLLERLSSIARAGNSA